jgi:putative flavoprotein involved in K+ transport
MQISVDPLPVTPEDVPREVNTLVVGAGQAGLAMSYWLSQAGVEHPLLERRATLGGAWQDRWDAFMPRDGLIDYFRHYAESIGAPVLTGTDVTQIAPTADGSFKVATTLGSWGARACLPTFAQ